MKYMLFRTLVCSLMLFVSACKTGSRSESAPICGVFSLQTSDGSIHHGVDLLVINADSTYVHFYAEGSSGENLVQGGRWIRGVGNSIGFSGFIAWDLFGPTPDGVMYPDPANTALPFRQEANGNYEIDADPDRGEKFVEIQQCQR